MSKHLEFVSVVVLLYSVVVTVWLLSLDNYVRSTYTCEQQDRGQQEQESHHQAQESLHLLQDKDKLRDAVPVPPWEQDLKFDGFDNEMGTSDGHYIVPNYVHFVKFGQTEFSFVDALCVLAAFKHQRPEILYIHTDLHGFHGKYWDVVANTTGLKDVLIVRKMLLPTSIFGQQLNKDWKNFHGSYVARILVLKEFGGIYLDSDSYLVRSLDDFRRFEMSVGWLPGKNFGNQVLVAHKNARFLHLWLESYRRQYRRHCWYCNTLAIPTQTILQPNPHLVHRVERLFGYFDVKEKIFQQKFPEWKDYYALHLHARRLSGGLENIVTDEVEAIKAPVAFRDMCKAVYPYPKAKKKKAPVTIRRT